MTLQDAHPRFARVSQWLPALGRRIGLPVLSLALYGCFALLLFFPVLSHPATTYIGGVPGPSAPDPLSFMWFLTWIPYTLAHHLNPFLTNWIFSDSGANLAWNNTVPLIGFVMGPITWAAGPIFSYNLALIASLTASAWTAYYVAFGLFRCGFLPALLAGAVYGFSPFMTAHAIGHLHLTMAFTPPLFLLVLHDIFIAQRQTPWISGAKLAVLALIQYFISVEVLLTVAIFASIGACVLLVSQRHAVTPKRVRHGVESLAVAILIVLPLLSYPLYLMFFGPWQPSHPIWGLAGAGNPSSLLSFVLPTSAEAIFGSLSVPLGRTNGEWNTYLGFPLIELLAIIGYAKRGNGTVRFLLALVLAVTVLSLGPSLHVGLTSTEIPLPWRLFNLVPLFSDVLTNRFGEYLYLLVGLILALYIADKSASRNRRINRAGLTLLAVAFLVPKIPLLPATRAEVPEFFRLPRDTQRVESPALVVPFAALLPPFAGPDRATAVLWQAEARMAFKMPEGYAIGQGSAWPTPTHLSSALIEIRNSGHAPTVTLTLKAQVIAELKAQRIKTILVGPSRHEREAVIFLVEILGWAPDPVDGVFVWWHVDRRLSAVAGRSQTRGPSPRERGPRDDSKRSPLDEARRVADERLARRLRRHGTALRTGGTPSVARALLPSRSVDKRPVPLPRDDQRMAVQFPVCAVSGSATNFTLSTYGHVLAGMQAAPAQRSRRCSGSVTPLRLPRQRAAGRKRLINQAFQAMRGRLTTGGSNIRSDTWLAHHILLGF